MTTLRPYLQSIRQALQANLCLQTFPSQQVERHNKPEVEIKENPELLLEPVLLTRSADEQCLIEGSINSVRISMRFGYADQIEQTLKSNYTRFLMQRADFLTILRRVPVEGYDISFLVTDEHCLAMEPAHIINLICEFVEEMDQEVSQLKLAVKARARAVAAELMKALAA